MPLQGCLEPVGVIDEKAGVVTVVVLAEFTGKYIGRECGTEPDMKELVRVVVDGGVQLQYPLELFTHKLLLDTVDNLDEIPVEELQDALDTVEGKKPTQPLLAAIAYENGVTQTELAGWHDVERRTVYNWLERLDPDEPLGQAAINSHLPRENQKNINIISKKFERTVHEPPTKVS